MKTLYDLLGALPDDDAESLRTAFRNAAKAAHPDANTDDPDAPLRFRQIIRANAILRDAAQRAAYDRLLAHTRRQPGPKSKRTIISCTIRKLASDAVVVILLSVVSIGGYVFFERLSQASAVPAEAIEVAAYGPAAIAAVVPTRQFDATVRDERDRLDGVAVPGKAVIPGVVAPSANSDSTPAIANVGPAADLEMKPYLVLKPDLAAKPDLAVKPDLGAKPDLAVQPDLSGNHARSYHERGIFAYRGGDLYLAIADFDVAIELDPSFKDAYIDRGIAFYRLQKFDRAFADIAQAKRIENSSRTKTPRLKPQ